MSDQQSDTKSFYLISMSSLPELPDLDVIIPMLKRTMDTKSKESAKAMIVKFFGYLQTLHPKMEYDYEMIYNMLDKMNDLNKRNIPNKQPEEMPSLIPQQPTAQPVTEQPTTKPLTGNEKLIEFLKKLDWKKLEKGELGSGNLIQGKTRMWELQPFHSNDKFLYFSDGKETVSANLDIYCVAKTMVQADDVDCSCEKAHFPLP